MKKKILERQGRQGDVLIERLSNKQTQELLAKNPQKLEPESGELILVKGEVTGHNHRVSALGAKLYAISAMTMLLILERENELLHHVEDHESFILPEGEYLIERQQEQTLEGFITPVRD